MQAAESRDVREDERDVVVYPTDVSNGTMSGLKLTADGEARQVLLVSAPGTQVLLVHSLLPTGCMAVAAVCTTAAVAWLLAVATYWWCGVGGGLAHCTNGRWH